MVRAMNLEEMSDFIENWLSAWTGNDPQRLAEYYHDEAIYVDPANREGLEGKKEILTYFERLLDYYQDWKWKPIEIFSTKKGCIVKWHCRIPVGSEVLLEVGLDIVEFKDGLISRNEVYFDRSRLLEAVQSHRRMHRLIS
jgi:hypothetical protein